MLYGLFASIFVLVCIVSILIILVQKGKGSSGIGSMGGGTQMLFGGSGGQDIFQKITWICIGIFLGGTLLLAFLKNTSSNESRYLSHVKRAPTPLEIAPETAPAATETPDQPQAA